MAPWTNALKVTPRRHAKGILEANIDSEWVVGSVPHGGYVLALILEACLIHQRNTRHPDPIHVSSHFLRPSIVGPCRIEMSTMKGGNTLETLTAKLIQNDHPNIVATLIFGTLPPFNKESSQTDLVTLAPPSPFARRTPLRTHPSACQFKPLAPRMRFNRHVQWAMDPWHEDSVKREDGPPSWAAWVRFNDQGQNVTPSTLPFLVDIFRNLPILLPDSGLRKMWFPTVFLSLEFKFAIPPNQKTVGVFAQGLYLNEGRHDTYVEVWTTPTGGEETDWREEPRCLCTSTQMNLCIPMEVNLRKGKL